MGTPETHATPGSGSHDAGRKSSEFVQSLDRGLAVIRAFGPEHDRLTLSEVARETGLTRAAARRFLLTLVALGYVRTNGKEFSLGPRVLELGYSYLSGMRLPDVAAPHVEALVAQVQESSSISVLDGQDVVDIVRVPAKRIMTVSVPVGTRFPAHASSKGRVLLAHLSPAELDAFLADAHLERLTDRTVTDADQLRGLLDDIRAKGYALVDQEVEEGVRSVAVPLAGRRRNGHRRDERVVVRDPGERRRRPARGASPAAGHGRADRGRSQGTGLAPYGRSSLMREPEPRLC